MKNKKKIISIGALVVAGAVLTLTSINHEQSPAKQPKEVTVSLEVNKNVAHKAKKELEIYIEDKSAENDSIVRYNIEKKAAKLTNTKVASFYLFDGYSSKEEKSGTTIISLDGNDKVYARIQKAAKNFDVDKYRQALQDKTEASIKVAETNPYDLPNTELQKASLFEIVSHTNTHPITNERHIINEFEHQLYQLDIFTEATKDESKIVNEFLSMLSTIHTEK